MEPFVLAREGNGKHVDVGDLPTRSHCQGKSHFKAVYLSLQALFLPPINQLMLQQLMQLLQLQHSKHPSVSYTAQMKNENLLPSGAT